MTAYLQPNNLQKINERCLFISVNLLIDCLKDRDGCRNAAILIFITGKRQAKQSAFFEPQIFVTFNA